MTSDEKLVNTSLNVFNNASRAFGNASKAFVVLRLTARVQSV